MRNGEREKRGRKEEWKMGFQKSENGQQVAAFVEASLNVV